MIGFIFLFLAAMFATRLDQSDPLPLEGTEGASLPFWAPGSGSIGFFADGWLKRLDLAGGRPQWLAQEPNGSHLEC